MGPHRAFCGRTRLTGQEWRIKKRCGRFVGSAAGYLRAIIGLLWALSRLKQNLSHDVYRCQVTVEWDKHDRYGRMVGIVFGDMT